MIKLIEGLTENVMGYNGIGKVTGGNCGRILMLAFEAKRKQFSKLRFIYTSIAKNMMRH